MLDQSHAVTDPAESLMMSATELVRACVQAHLVDREALARHQEQNDALMALQALKEAFTCDVSPILGMARSRAGGAIDPVAAFRESGYREAKVNERQDSYTADRTRRVRRGLNQEERMRPGFYAEPLTPVLAGGHRRRGTGSAGHDHGHGRRQQQGGHRRCYRHGHQRGA